MDSTLCASAFFVGTAYAMFMHSTRVMSQITGGNDNNMESKSKKNKKSMLYTKTGDKGKSMLYNGEIREKSDVVFEALGATDELNASIGVAREYCLKSKNGLDPELETIQSRLLDVGAAIATPQNKSADKKLERTRFNPSFVKNLEEWTDEYDGRCEPLTTFILPSGGLCSAHLHVARTICRRAERQVVPLIATGEVDEEVGRYLNRLSDFLFAAARWAAKHDGAPTVIWRKH